MRIAILADFPLSALSGGAVGRGGGQGCTWLPQLALAFEKMPEFEIHWVILDRREKRAETLKQHGQTFHRVPSVSFSVDLALRCLPARRTLKRVLASIQPDLVHAWGTELIYPCVLRDCRVPTILSMQGILTEYQRIGGLPNDWRWRAMIASEPKYIRAATLVTSESQWGINRVKEIHPSAQCRMVEYGVHPDFFQLDWMPNPALPYALYVGGAGSRKGFDILVEALKRMPHRSWEMRLAGDMEMGEICRREGLQNVTCLGLLPWKEMQAQLQGAWCFTLPTRGDTSPNSVKEARVIGLPVVTSLHGGQSGYICDGENGKIVEPLDAEHLAQALDSVMASYSVARTLGAGRHVADRAYLSSELTARGFASVYSEFRV